MTKKNKKSEVRSGLKAEWVRIKSLIPHVIKPEGIVEDVEKDIFDLIDGNKTCEEVVKLQDLSTDSAVLIFMRLERGGIVHCVEPSEKLRDVKFEKSEAFKDLEFIKIEKNKLKNKMMKIKGETLHVRSANRAIKNTVSSLRDRLPLIDENIDRLSKQYKDAMTSVDRLVGGRMDMVKQVKDIDRSLVLIREEMIFLKDEKWSAMKSIKELEGKIEGVLMEKESFAPRLSAYRSLIREAYKTLRSASERADNAIKGVENRN